MHFLIIHTLLERPATRPPNKKNRLSLLSFTVPASEAHQTTPIQTRQEQREEEGGRERKRRGERELFAAPTTLLNLALGGETRLDDVSRGGLATDVVVEDVLHEELRCLVDVHVVLGTGLKP